MAPAAKDMKIGFRIGIKLTAKSPIIAPAGSDSPERKAALNKKLFFFKVTIGVAIANSSGML